MAGVATTTSATTLTTSTRRRHENNKTQTAKTLGLSRYGRIEGQAGVIISNMSTAQRDALVLLDHSLLKDPRVNLGKLREPRPRRRGWR